ncbi:hypothetical protein ACP3S7_18040 [Phytobacter ursingii]
MKIKKFGTITTDSEGNVCVRNFVFMAESPEEKHIDVNSSKNAEYTISVIANFLMSECSYSPLPEKADFKSERIVADAIRKAKSSEV